MKCGVKNERMLLLDSDILFFSEPVELLRRIEDVSYEKNSLNKDWGCGYIVNWYDLSDLLGTPEMSSKVFRI